MFQSKHLLSFYLLKLRYQSFEIFVLINDSEGHKVNLFELYLILYRTWNKGAALEPLVEKKGIDKDQDYLE